MLRRGAGFATLSAAYARGDVDLPVRESRGPADRPAPYGTGVGAVRAVVAVDARTEVQATLAAFTDRRERGTAFTANRSEGAERPRASSAAWLLRARLPPDARLRLAIRRGECRADQRHPDARPV
ncbi:hypothetical protein AB5I41_07340 [Sphingomonas sp. MMS24-JH45]